MAELGFEPRGSNFRTCELELSLLSQTGMREPYNKGVPSNL